MHEREATLLVVALVTRALVVVFTVPFAVATALVALAGTAHRRLPPHR